MYFCDDGISSLLQFYHKVITLMEEEVSTSLQDECDDGSLACLPPSPIQVSAKRKSCLLKRRERRDWEQGKRLLEAARSFAASSNRKCTGLGGGPQVA